jgi:hypothetical protein
LAKRKVEEETMLVDVGLGFGSKRESSLEVVPFGYK